MTKYYWQTETIEHFRKFYMEELDKSDLSDDEVSVVLQMAVRKFCENECQLEDNEEVEDLTNDLMKQIK